MAGCIRSKIRYHHPRTSRRADDSRRNHLTSFTGKASPVCDNNGTVTTDEDKKGDGMDSIQFGSFARRRDATPHARRRKAPRRPGTPQPKRRQAQRMNPVPNASKLSLFPLLFQQFSQLGPRLVH
jgi:hypothetical protein